jgi:hypothetical protein
VHVLDQTSERHDAGASPEWVSDWWMPADHGVEPAAGDDLAVLLAPEPVIRIEVTGRQERSKARAL